MDKVFVDLRDRQPGRYPIHNLRERERFIEAVKELMDGEWLTELYFTEDYQVLVIQEPIERIINSKQKSIIKTDWYGNKKVDEEEVAEENEPNGLPEDPVHLSD